MDVGKMERKRDKMENNRGLVLEGGGMRGIFTAGVLDFFLEKNVNFDNCLAVSAGACLGASYMSKQHKRGFNAIADSPSVLPIHFFLFYRLTYYSIFHNLC